MNVSSLFFIYVIHLIVVTVKKSDAQPHLDPPLRHLDGDAADNPMFYNDDSLIKELFPGIDSSENSELPAGNKVFQRWHSRENSDEILRDSLPDDLTAAFDDVPVNSVA